MADKRPISILLMDDEIDSPVIQATLQHLENEGFNVDYAQTMSEAIDAYYKKYYDVFILDIDMSMINDEQDGDGINVLKRFISLHNQTKVIIYSAAGKSPHWVAATNAHCYAYVHKSEKDALHNLTGFIRKSLTPDSDALYEINNKTVPQKVLLYTADDRLKVLAQNVIAKTLGSEWEIMPVDSLELASDAAKTVDNFSEVFGVIVILQPIFKMRRDEKKFMETLLSQSPFPNVIVGCEANDDYQDQILSIANSHPFRLLDILRDDFAHQLAQGLSSAKIWYGRREIFQADPDALQRLDINLDDDILDEWTGDEDELNQMYDDFYADTTEKGEES